LVVEDNDPLRDALSLFLVGEGHTVVVADNCKEALAFLRRASPPDFILLDLNTPQMDGYEFRKQQLQDPALASIPVVVLSAGSVAEQSDLLGDVGYLQKPVDADLLLSAIHRFTAPEKPVVLVVDDVKEVGTMLAETLRHYGFAVRLAISGQQAMELYREQYQSIAVVLLDVQMPKMDGPATLAALRQINPKLKCCFMSGSTGKYSSEQLQKMGATHVFVKPFVNLNLVTRLLWELIAADRCSSPD
jgi:CheY-like chemotaxis protein